VAEGHKVACKMQFVMERILEVPEDDKILEFQKGSTSLFSDSQTPHSCSLFFIVIGAPKANTSQPGVTEGGAVFLCTWSPRGACDIIDFDLTGQVITVGVSDIINSGRSNEPVQYVTGIHQSDEQGGYDLYRDEAQRDSNVGLFYQVKIYDGRMRSSLRVHHTFMGVQVKSQGVPFCLDVYELNVDLRHLGLLQVASYFGHSVAVADINSDG
ncbi:hypothetical protein GOODEAATRI_016963, partial [Goodea atripinnis]